MAGLFYPMKLPLNELLANSFYYPKLSLEKKDVYRNELDEALERFFGVCGNNASTIIQNLEEASHLLSKKKALELLKETQLTDEDKQNLIKVE